MDVELRNQLKPGVRVRVTQQIAARDYSLGTDVRGTVVEFEQKRTGSWFAHSKGDRLWLDRLVIRKDDGEISTLNLDEFSHIQIETPAAPAA
jgi:hypothetical protein